MALPKLIQLNDSNFESEILRQPKPALVCLWATWSGPSKLLSPLIAEMAETHSSQFLIAMLDVDKSPLTSAIYGIRTLPTFLVFQDGEVMRRIQGAVSRTEIEKLFLGKLPQ